MRVHAFYINLEKYFDQFEPVIKDGKIVLYGDSVYNLQGNDVNAIFGYNHNKSEVINKLENEIQDMSKLSEYSIDSFMKEWNRKNELLYKRQLVAA